MSRYHPTRELLGSLALDQRFVLLDSMMAIDRLAKGKAVPKKENEALLELSSALSEWGLEDFDRFASTHQLTMLSLDILYQRDGKKWSVYETPRPTTKQVFKAMKEEYDNLLKVLFRDAGADLEKAKKFVIILHQIALNDAWSRTNRRGLAA